jgi:hypothetical protein
VAVIFQPDAGGNSRCARHYDGHEQQNIIGFGPAARQRLCLSFALDRSTMPRTFDQSLADFAALQPSDFDNEAAGICILNELTDELMALPQPERAIPALFGVMERMPDVEMGTPGPLVHTLEQMRGLYERELVESIKRQPAGLSIWMVNRILNATRVPEQRQFYMDLLQFAAEHPAATKYARHEARFFIEHQNQRKAV